MSSLVAVAVLNLNSIANVRLRRTEDGQDLLEYALLTALIALAALSAVASVGVMINTVFWQLVADAFSAL